MPPFLFLTTRAKEPGIDPVALKLFDGSAGNDGVLLVRGESAAGSLKDLKGKTWCFHDTKSTTGYALPRAAFKEAGLDPDTDLVPRRTEDHHGSLKDLLAGLCDVAGTYSGAYLSADKAEINASKLRVLAITGRSPQDTIVAASTVSSEDRGLVLRALLAFDPEPITGHRNLGTVEKISGFREVHPTDYASLESAFKEELDRLRKASGATETPAPPGTDDAAPSPPDDNGDKGAERRPRTRKKRRR